MSPEEYLAAIERAHRRGDATEHTYRPFLKTFLETRAKGDAEATNEPKREKCGAPDYVVSRKKDRLTLGYVEAKDVGLDLAEIEKGEQITRYLQHLPNFLLTDYLSVRWYVRGDKGIEKRGSASLGHIGTGGKIVSDPAEQARALNLIDSFLQQRPVPINSALDLALRLAHLTHMVRDTIVDAFAYGEASQQLRDWREAFAATLLPELMQHSDAKKETEARAKFADMFAQTLAYGLFSARVAAPGKNFSRELARKLIPRTNPFLRSFFEQITGSALDDEPFAGFVEDLIQTLAYSDTDSILEDFGKRGRRTDPVVHFYETFLQAYDPKLRELRGVYFTPEPVVNYIVESLDLLLKSKFSLKNGLADRSQITVTRHEGEKEIRETTHRVLILDPATGTATFLYRVLDFIREQFERSKKLGAWGDYVHEHLLPRLFGFELLMAPYAVAHFKLGLALAAWDKEPLFRQGFSYEPQKDERINIFLTNTLEDIEDKAQQLGPLRMLSDEAHCAFEVKRNKPVLVILGNPPYSNFGQQNRGKWILGLLDEYKRGLNEKKINLNDDFIKFIRWAQWRVEQTGSGVIGMIVRNVFLDGLTHRRMRESLLEAFDEIYVLNLHGSKEPLEMSPDGSVDDNVFQIKKGVAIVLFVKLPATGKKRQTMHATVRHADLWGRQAAKYKWLDAQQVEKTKWTKLKPSAPRFYFVPKDFAQDEEYRGLPSVTDIFPVSNNGLKTDRDELFFDFNKLDLQNRMQRFFIRDLPDAFREKYRIVDSTSYDIAERRHKVTFDPKALHKCLYRPFDVRWLYYDPGLTSRPAEKVMRHMIAGDNLALIATRQTKDELSVLAVDKLAGHKSCAGYDINTVFPLYLYPNGKLPEDDLFVREEPDEPPRRPNLSADFIADFCLRLKVKFVPEGLGWPAKREVGPELIFHYAYAVFHSPGYRERYAEFLRTDFPRLPLTGDYELFRELSGLGGWLVDLHARGHGEGKGPGFPLKGNNLIEEVRYEPPKPSGSERHGGRVWINDLQHFEPVPPESWEFPIGGYQPAERWLKDRTGRTLGYDDLSTYARIIHALGETRRLMAEIDKTIAAHGGWPGAFQKK
jgi:hypothetical protein